jgi:zinc transport system ATP-binding protein
MEPAYTIKYDDVRYCYGDVCAVNNIGFSIEPNTLVAIIGPNGGGKSTLLKLIAGILKPDRGNVIMPGKPAVGYVSQTSDFDLSFPMTVIDMVLTGTLCKNIKPFCRYTGEQRENARNALERVGLSGYGKRGIDQLSGGELKKAVIARVLASDAQVIVLDEPDGNLDVDAADDLYRVLQEIKRDKTVIVASHHIDKILDIADSSVYVNRTASHFPTGSELKEKLRGRIFI